MRLRWCSKGDSNSGFIAAIFVGGFDARINGHMRDISCESNVFTVMVTS